MPVWSDLADLVGDELSEPDVSVRSGRDGVGSAAALQRVLGDRPVRRDLADLVGFGFGEPEIAVRPAGDAQRGGGRGGQGVDRGHAAGGDFPDAVAVEFGEPKIAVRPAGDAVKVQKSAGDRVLDKGRVGKGRAGREKQEREQEEEWEERA